MPPLSKLFARPKALDAFRRHRRIKAARQAQADHTEAYGTPRIIFLHLPKSGGTSLRRFLADRFDGVRIDEYRNDLAFVDAAKTAPFVYGHFGADVLQQIRGDAFAFTIMRNPRRRLISEYTYLSGYGPKVFPGLDHVPTFTQFLQSGLRDNTMTRFLAKAPAVRDDQDMSDEELLERATKTLLSLDAVGYQETLDASMAAICAASGIFWGDGIPRINKTPNVPKPEIDEDLIAEANRLDDQIFALAQEKFPVPAPVRS